MARTRMIAARVRPGRVLLSQETWRALLGELDELRRQVRELRQLVPAPEDPPTPAVQLLAWLTRRSWEHPRLAQVASQGPLCVRARDVREAAVAELVVQGLVREEGERLVVVRELTTTPEQRMTAAGIARRLDS